MTDKQTRRDYREDDNMFYGAHWSNGNSLPVVLADDGFFEAVDSFVIALRWPIFCFGMVALLFFIVAMIIWLPWAK